jgi:tetratricopeptide (TPR) repeat protein
VIRRRQIVAFIALLVFVGPTSAQERSGNLKVRVTFSDGHPCNLRVLVRLMLSAGSTPIAENYADENGFIDFEDVAVGNYHLIVSGDGVVETDSGLFEVDNRKGTQYQTVTVKRTDEVEHGKPSDATVSVASLSIPKNAHKLFAQATDSIATQDWTKAIEQLNKAVALFPQYVQAYTNLGVVYHRMGDRDKERVALEKAISLDDHYAPAWVNMGWMAIAQQNFPAAETALEKATALDPTNALTLLMLANVELMNLHYDQAIANCRKVHAIGSDSHALAHFIAARAFEHESRLHDATAELKTFLKEEPSGARADAARKELANLERLPR